MRKQLTMLLAAALCASSIALGGCGQTSASTSDATSTSEASAEKEEASKSESADPSEKFLGNWVFACAETQGITIAGDMSELMGTDKSLSIGINKDGTGTVYISAEDSGDVTWKLIDDDTLNLIPQYEGATETLTLTYDEKYDALNCTMNDEDFNGTLIFTADGTYKGAETLDIDQAKDATSLNNLVGTWNLYGMSMGGMVMLGSPDDLAAMSGDSFDTKLTIDADGTATTNDEKGSITIGKDGAVFSLDDQSIPVKLLDDYLVLDMGAFAETSFFMVYSK